MNLQQAYRLICAKVPDKRLAYKIARHVVQFRTSVVIAMYRLMEPEAFDGVVIGGESARSLIR